jgi:hypothetical protein
MQRSRDSSVWRSLASAFGDGLAFGAGVKLSQKSALLAAGKRAPALADAAQVPRMDPARVEAVERRLAMMEAAKPATPALPAFDQKMLEAVVYALDVRLKEHSNAVERRLAALETRVMADLQSLRRQDHAIISAVEGQIEEVQDCFVSQLEGVHRQLAQDRATVRQAIRAAAQEASAAAVEDALAPALAAATEKDHKIEELRHKVEESDSALLDLVNGIGELIRRAGGRRSGEPEAAAPAAAEPAQLDPAIAQPAKPARLWKVPLVSSMVVVAAFGLAMTHYF